MFKKTVKRVIPFAVISTLLIGSGYISLKPDAEAKMHKQHKAKNIIFMIGDGMGEANIAAHRYMKDNPDTKELDRTTFDKYKAGSQMTIAEDEDQNITDSASAATAMSSGVKTYNAAIAVDNDKSEVKTVLEAAKEKGKATGLVATSELTHATPAAFGAHDENRKNMDAIADDYFDQKVNGKHKVDVMLGGGMSNFIRKDRNLAAQFKKDGYSVVTNKQDLLRNDNSKILGVFSPGGMPKMIDRTADLPSLEDMTKTAIKKLKTDRDGFFLMVEGSQIDWANHDNDIVASMSEMEDFERAFKAVIDFAKKDGNTLVVATADHGTGGLTVGSSGVYNWNTEPIKAAKRTPDFISNEILNGANVEQTLAKYIDLPLTPEEVKSVKDAVATKKVDDAIEAIFNARSYTGWTTSGHTGEDVPLYAYGPEKQRFAGLIDNTDNAKIIFDLLKSNHKIKDK
ncbi:alkaline phosphatase [Peribacillus sp. SCS-37]|uniref:alkaline phosphatase n=1 Tax=Paraperibacillus esterisolvens TaxID=3115296 RepID=UPI0039062614